MLEVEQKALHGPSQEEFIKFVQETERTDEQIRRRIDALNVSADAKALLNDLLNMSTKIGEFTLRIGRKILDFVLSTIQTFPQLSFAVLVSLVLAALFALIPFIGPLLSPILTPLALALGISWGALKECAAPDLSERVSKFAAAFAPLKA